MSEPDLEAIMHRVRHVPCPACGTECDPDDAGCPECGSALEAVEDDGTGLSLMAEEAGASARGRSVPLERARNYRALRAAADGALEGGIDNDTYRAVMQRIKTIAVMGVKVFESDVARERFSTLPESERAVAVLMEAGFRRLQTGVNRMERWLTTSDANDVSEGWRDAEQGWIDIDRAQEMALEIAETRET